MPCFKPALTVILTVAAFSKAKSIGELFSSTPELSNFTSIASMYPDFVTTLSGVSGITVLAPNNKAVFNNMKIMPAGARNNVEHIKSLLVYHVLNGTYRVGDFGDEPEFLTTLLTAKKYANATAGEPQVVKAVLMDDHAAVYSGLNRVSMVSRAVSPSFTLSLFLFLFLFFRFLLLCFNLFRKRESFLCLRYFPMISLNNVKSLRQ